MMSFCTMPAHVGVWFLILAESVQSLVLQGAANSTATHHVVFVPPPLECHGWPEPTCGLAEGVVAHEVLHPPVEEEEELMEPPHKQTVRDVGAGSSCNGHYPVHITMQDQGRYGEHAASQAAYLNLLRAGILGEATEGAVIFDLGCADGMNSKPLLRHLEGRIKNFQMVFNDLPANDWKITSAIIKDSVDAIYPINGAVTDFDPANANKSGAQAYLVGKSFYENLAPQASVDIAFCSTAVQYLSPESTNCDQPVWCPNCASQVAARIPLAAADWLKFLKKRTYELKPGGTLHICALHTTQQGRNIGPIWHLVKKTMGEALIAGYINLQQQFTWQWPGYPRTSEEFQAPFANQELPHLQLQKFHVVYLESPYWTQSGQDADRFADLYVPSVMAWIGPYMEKTLGLEFTDLLQQNLRADVVEHPTKWKHDFEQAIMVMRKVM